VTRRLSPSEIKQYLDAVIEKAAISEPLLANRLRDLKKWIATKKDGFLSSKVQVLDLLTEVVIDSELWLNLSELSSNERLAFYEEEQLTSAEKFWIDVLFPSWFKERDPHSPIWKQKIMAGEFPQNDEKLIGTLQEEIENFGGSTLWRYILDLSMATDLLVAGDLETPICVQLTTNSGEWLNSKNFKWKEILFYWNIPRGLLISYSPKRLNYSCLAKVILQDSDTLPHSCYSKRIFQ
jgi:hypothetical protein